ncbi:hypothetical protein TRIP_B40210 [uncultured Desulfatiglans sp.]|nr:hypothetical protein TRIP_B40210 [uncultured Desulfatiglans sp.]
MDRYGEIARVFSQCITLREKEIKPSVKKMGQTDLEKFEESE